MTDLTRLVLFQMTKRNIDFDGFGVAESLLPMKSAAANDCLAMLLRALIDSSSMGFL